MSLYTFAQINMIQVPMGEHTYFNHYWPGRIGQSVGHLTRKSEVLGSHTFVSPSADSRGAVVTYW